MEKPTILEIPEDEIPKFEATSSQVTARMREIHDKLIEEFKRRFGDKSQTPMTMSPSNLTQSLKVSSASYVECERQFKNSAGVVIHSGVYKDYLFTVNNLSSNIIDAVIIIFRQNGVLKGISPHSL